MIFNCNNNISVKKKMSKRNKKRKEGENQAVINWEEDGYFPRKIKEEMKSMWEVRKSLILLTCNITFFF